MAGELTGINSHARKPIVFIDLDGTLHDAHSSWSIAQTNAVRAMVASGLGAELDEALETLGEIYRTNPNSRRQVELLARHYLRDRFRGRALQEHVNKVVTAGVTAISDTLSNRRVFRPFSDVKAHLRFLKENGIAFYIVTDGLPEKQWSKLHRLGLAHLIKPHQLICTDRSINPFHFTPFTSMHVLYDPKSRPKNAAFYKRVLRRLGLSPEDATRAIMVGDREGSDITPAKHAGIGTTIRIKREGGKYATEPSNADYQVRSLTEVTRIIRQRMKMR